MNRRTRSRVAAVVMVAVLVLTLVGSLLASSESGTSSDDPSGDTAALVDQDLLPGPGNEPVQGPTDDPVDPGGEAPEPARYSDLPPVAVSALPPEALDTIVLIDQGGPFPYDRDGVTFFNREGRLPPHPEGWYREYTVPTPGEDDRGARRIVVGQDGAVFYTADHYESFSEVVSG